MWEGNKKRGEGKRPNDEQLTTLVHLLCAVLARKSSAMFLLMYFYNNICIQCSTSKQPLVY